MGNKEISGFGTKSERIGFREIKKGLTKAEEETTSKQIIKPKFQEDHFSPDPINIEIDQELVLASSKITTAHFQMISVIGRGTFGKVFLVRHRGDGRFYAIKALKKNLIVKTMQVEHTKSERRLLEQLKHPFIVTMKYAFQTHAKLYMVFEYVSGGELFHHLKKAGRFTEDRARFYAAQLLLALDFLHGKKIVYRDLKPENILLDPDGNIKLTDFGLAKELGKVEDDPESGKTTTFCGTDEYIAPEVLSRQPYGKSVDWWAFGVLIYEMLTGVPPWRDKNRKMLYKKIASSPLDTANPYLSDISADLLSKLLLKNVNERMKPEHIKFHPFFNGKIDFDLLLKKEIKPPFKPVVKTPADVSNFDPLFTKEDPYKETPEITEKAQKTVKNESYFKGFTFASTPELSIMKKNI